MMIKRYFIWIIMAGYCGSGFAQINELPSHSRKPPKVYAKPLQETYDDDEQLVGATNRLFFNPFRRQTYDHYGHLHFGFVFSMVTLDYRITSSRAMVNTEVFGDYSQAYANLSSLAGGFGVSVLCVYRINQMFDLRLQLGPVFGSRDITFWGTENGAQSRTMRMESILVEMPLLLKYKAVRTSNFRPYMITGLSPSVNVTAFRKFNEEKGIYIGLNPWDLSLNVGTGIDIYFDFFKFAFEVKFMTGFMDNVSKNSLPGYELYPSTIKKAMSQGWVVSFFFE